MGVDRTRQDGVEKETDEASMTTGGADSATNAAAEEAAVWFGRMADRPVSPAERKAFEDWMASTPVNRAAYEELAAIWSSRYFEAALRRAESDDRQREEQLPRVVPALRSWQLPLGLAAAASIVALAVLVLFQIEVFETHESTVVYETFVGERRTVELTDGSSVELNAATRLEVSIGDAERHVHLSRGEVYLDVKHDGRPFVVEGGTGRIAVLGTAFDVRVVASEMDVAVERGRVAVSPASGRRASQVLQPGQAITVRNGQLGSARAVGREIADWRDGWLDFSNESLAQVVSELNRYHAPQIRLGRDELAGLKVTGRIDLADVERAVRVLARSMGLEVRESGAGDSVTLE